MMRALLVEDEPYIREIIMAYLEKEGWSAEFTSDGNEAIRLFDRNPHDLVLLDLMIEGMPGEEVCTRIREKSNVPIMMITSKTREQDTIRGLNLGADDYIAKPFRVKELIARIHALLRRTERQQTAGLTRKLSFNGGRLKVDLAAAEVISDGRVVSLTGTEFKLLSILIEVPGKVHNRKDLLYKLSGYRYAGDSRLVDTHIKNLRKKIEPDVQHPIYVLTLFGTGYKFAFQTDE
jgi:DNA-binding response OmpR family regulator